MCLFLVCVECGESFESEASRGVSRLHTVDEDGAILADIILSQCDACRESRRSPWGESDGDEGAAA